MSQPSNPLQDPRHGSQGGAYQQGYQPGQNPPPAPGGNPQAGYGQPGGYQQGGYQQPGGYQQGGYQQAPAGPNPLVAFGLPRILGAASAVLGLIVFLVGFADFAKTKSVSASTPYGGEVTVQGGGGGSSFETAAGAPVLLFLAAAILAAVAILPQFSSAIVTSAALALAGWLTVLMVVFSFSDRVETAAGGIMILIFGFLQVAAAVAAVVLTILKPSPKAS